ncbi:hypothetical protein Tco_0304213 [Tanacetum coccineum]
MILMVERNRGEHVIRRFTGRCNEPDPRDVKIDDGSEDVNPFGGGNPRFHDNHYDNPLLTKETKSEPIIWDIGDEEEEYPFVNKYLKEEGFVGKGGFGGEEDNIEDVVVVANVKTETRQRFSPSLTMIMSERFCVKHAIAIASAQKNSGSLAALSIVRAASARHLEEKHMTWARFGKKLDKNTTFQACYFHSDAFTKSAQKVKFLIKVVTSQVVETASEITTDVVIVEERWRHHAL